MSLSEDLGPQTYDLAGDVKGVYRIRRRGVLRVVENWVGVVGSVFWWMVPGLGLSAGQSTCTILLLKRRFSIRTMFFFT